MSRADVAHALGRKDGKDASLTAEQGWERVMRAAQRRTEEVTR